jgi:hypothetical protein
MICRSWHHGNHRPRPSARCPRLRRCCRAIATRRRSFAPMAGLRFWCRGDLLARSGRSLDDCQTGAQSGWSSAAAASVDSSGVTTLCAQSLRPALLARPAASRAETVNSHGSSRLRAWVHTWLVLVWWSGWSCRSGSGRGPEGSRAHLLGQLATAAQPCGTRERGRSPRLIPPTRPHPARLGHRPGRSASRPGTGHNG